MIFLELSFVPTKPGLQRFKRRPSLGYSKVCTWVRLLLALPVVYDPIYISYRQPFTNLNFYYTSITYLLCL